MVMQGKYRLAINLMLSEFYSKILLITCQAAMVFSILESFHLFLVGNQEQMCHNLKERHYSKTVREMVFNVINLFS